MWRWQSLRLRCTAAWTHPGKADVNDYDDYVSVADVIWTCACMHVHSTVYSACPKAQCALLPLTVDEMTIHLTLLESS